MALTCAHFKLGEFARPGEHYHFARTELVPENGVRSHDHDYHEVFWATRGEGLHTWNGVSGPILPGVVHLIRPQDRHRVEGATEALVCIINVAFPSSAWREVRQRYFADAPDWFEQPQVQRAWVVEPRIQSVLHHWADQLATVSRPRVALDGFLMELPRLRPVAARTSHEPIPDWLAKARREIVHPRHFMGGAPGFVKLAGRSASHVSRAAVRWLGTTPTEIVNAARMDYCAEQLAETTKPILEIMFDCGLTNLSHFYALFRRRFEVSPRRYRLQSHSTVRG